MSAVRSRVLWALAAAALAGCARRGSMAPPAAEPRAWPEHLAASIAAVGEPGAKRAFQVGPGARVWTGQMSFRWSLADDPTAVATPVAFETDGVPVAHVGLLGARESLAVEAAAVPDAAIGDSSLLMSVRARGDP